MNAKKIALSVMLFSLLTLFSCRDDKKTKETIDAQIEQIESTEMVIDSTLNAVSDKATEVESLIKEIDSI